MRNIFRKLDVASRVEVARVLERAERGSDELRGVLPDEPAQDLRYSRAA